MAMFDLSLIDPWVKVKFYTTYFGSLTQDALLVVNTCEDVHLVQDETQQAIFYLSLTLGPKSNSSYRDTYMGIAIAIFLQ